MLTGFPRIHTFFGNRFFIRNLQRISDEYRSWDRPYLLARELFRPFTGNFLGEPICNIRFLVDFEASELPEKETTLDLLSQTWTKLWFLWSGRFSWYNRSVVRRFLFSVECFQHQESVKIHEKQSRVEKWHVPDLYFTACVDAFLHFLKDWKW